MFGPCGDMQEAGPAAEDPISPPTPRPCSLPLAFRQGRARSKPVDAGQHQGAGMLGLGHFHEPGAGGPLATFLSARCLAPMLAAPAAAATTHILHPHFAEHQYRHCDGVLCFLSWGLTDMGHHAKPTRRLISGPFAPRTQHDPEGHRQHPGGLPHKWLTASTRDGSWQGTVPKPLETCRARP